MAFTEVGGVPEIVGGELPDDVVTKIENAGKLVVALPSDTETTILPWIPASEAAGVPVNLPFVELKFSQVGFAATLKVKGS
ncbi:MAG: hypothetical protein OEY72_10280, partial [Gammaproteobacteria bacterium]|nr:hypothetical protein [Gammaproteobacteria bacterium]